MDSPKPNLLILTAHYPCGEGEDFIGQELPFLSEQFQVSIVTADVQSEITRPLPVGVTFSRMPSFTQSGKTAENVRARFSKEYRKEAAALKQRGDFTSEIRRSTLDALVASAHVARYIEQLDEFSSPVPLVICSCRYNHLAYAGVRIKKAREARKIGATCAVVRCHRKDMESPLPLSVCVDEGADGIYCGGETAHTQYVSRYARSNTPSKYRIARIGTQEPGGLTPEKTEDDLYFRIVTRGLNQQEAALLTDALSRIREGSVYWTHLGTQEDDLNALKSSAAALHTSDHVSCEILGPVSHEQAIKFYRSTRVDAFIQLNEPSSFLPLLESMSCGILPVAVNSGCNKDLVNDDHGLLLPKDTTGEELAQVLTLLARMSPERLAPQRAKARKWWKDYYNNEKNYRKFAGQLAAEAARL